MDRHNEALTLGALEAMVEGVNSTYIPMGVEHDPREPPIGRVVSAAIVELSDGEYAVDGEIEVFEPGDRIPFGDEGRRAHVSVRGPDRLVVAGDRVFRDREDQEILAEIASDLDADRETEAKKSLEAIGVLLIGFKLAGGAAVGAVGKRIGDEAWNRVLPKLKKLFSRRRNTPAQLLQFAVTADLEGETRSIEVILSDPSATDLDSFKPSVIQKAIDAASREVSRAPYLVRFVFEYSEKSGLTLLYSVASNGVPVHGKAAVRPVPASADVSVGGSRGDV